MGARALDFRIRRVDTQSGLTFLSDSTQASGRVPRRLADRINSSSLRTSNASEATSLAFGQPKETRSRPSEYFNYQFPSLRMFWGSGKGPHRSSCNGAQRLARAHGNGNGYARVEAPKTNNCSLLTVHPPASDKRNHFIEQFIERVIFNCRFFTLMAIIGSLAGSLVCFFKGCVLVIESFFEYFHASLNGFDTGQVILLLVEAVDVYLFGTVMLIFGMGLYELFVNSIAIPRDDSSSGYTERNNFGSSLFGLFQLRKRPSWLEIRSVDELKTRLGHVIVMILLVGMFEKSKKVAVNSGVDLLCYAASILMSSGSLFFLSKLHSCK